MFSFIIYVCAVTILIKPTLACWKCHIRFMAGWQRVRQRTYSSDCLRGVILKPKSVQCASQIDQTTPAAEDIRDRLFP